MSGDRLQNGPRSVPGHGTPVVKHDGDGAGAHDPADKPPETDPGRDGGAGQDPRADVTPWLPPSVGSGQSRVRLFCFPHLGGGTAVYNSWSRSLSADIELVPVYFPGRESRLNEPAIDNMLRLVAELADAFGPWINVPFAFFGHSMGAVVAFELARRLESDGESGPICLFVSSCPAPDRVKNNDPRHTKSDEEMITALVNAFGVEGGPHPDEIALMRMMAPTIRADIKLLETYQSQPLPRLSCPIVAIRGTQDRQVSFPDIVSWEAFTTASCSARAYPGGHFFLRDQQRGIVRLINSQLTRYLP